MFNKLFKSLLVFNENHKPAPNFIIIYCLIWLFWHQQMFTSFIITQGDIATRFTAAINSVNNFQYLVVLLLSCLFYALRLSYYYLQSIAHQVVDQHSKESLGVGSDQLIVKNEDVQRVMAMLDDTKNQLASVKASEQQTKAENKSLLTRLMKLEAELEELQADNTLTHQLNEELKDKLRQVQQRNGVILN